MKCRFIIVALMTVLLPSYASSQNIVSAKLPNGLTIFICEDPAQHEVLGEVVVRTGSVNDPQQYTGLAHYLEHVMFKGTQKIGALDWENEKPVYEQIVAKYDELAQTKDEAARSALLKEINDLTVKESELSLSQEYSNLIESIGGNSLNAGTNYDYTVYYNTFPANQIIKWLTLASERFINPVFRAFQSELETVYEEYNMYSDDPQSLTRQFIFEKAFEGSPYERDVIGLGEHLKNPRLSQLIKFYNDWYVPENMALIISGNVKAQAILRSIKSTFGRLQPRPVPERASYPGFNVKGRKTYTSKFSYYPSTCLIFNGVKQGDPDEYALDVMTMLLSNGSSTGLLDKLSLAGDLMSASASTLTFAGQGRVLLLAIPYYDEAQGCFDSSRKVESYLMKAVNSLKNGEFSNETFEAVKTNLCRDFDLSMESNDGKVSFISQSFVSGMSVEEMLSFKDRIKAVTVEDIRRVAAKYLTSDFIVLDNQEGKPDRKNKISKPDYKPVNSPTGKTSAYAQWFKTMQAPAPVLSFIEWDKVQQKQINSYSKLYYSHNQENDIYTLELKYGANSKIFPKLEVAADLMNSAGVMAQYSFDSLKQAFGNIGATYSIYADDEYLNITLRGYERNLTDACVLLTKLLLMPSLDEKQLNNLKGSIASSRMRRTMDVNVLGDALNEYVAYGDESQYRREISDQDVIDLDISSLTGDIANAGKYAAQIHYSGSLPFDVVSDILSKNLPLVSGELPSTAPLIRPMKEYKENTVYFLPNSDAQQAQIYFYVPMGDYKKGSDLERFAFNQYFSGGFNGLVMQEIREKNSMAYTAYGLVATRALPGSQVYFSGYVGTQNDKALSAIDLFSSLLKDMPQNPESITNLRNYIKESLLTQQPDARSITKAISRLESQGYSDDPSKEWVAKVDSLTFDDVVKYYKENLQGKPVIIGVVGNPKDINAKDLAKFGKVVKLSEKRLFNEEGVLFR